MTTFAQSRGTLTLIAGPMFAGKTTEMVVRLLALNHDGRRAVVVLYADDDRYNVGDRLATHNFPVLPALEETPHFKTVRARTLAEARALLGTPLPELIGVDEGQMFLDLARASEWADAGACVFVAALSSDFRRVPFAHVAALVPETVISRAAECMACRARAAAFTHRTAGGTELLQIGGAESYIALCRACYTAANGDGATVAR